MLSPVFRLTKPTPEDIQREIEAASRTELPQSDFLDSRAGLKISALPSGFAHDRSRTRLGIGESAFNTAARGFEHWRNFDLGWVSVANPSARIKAGQVVAVQVHSLGLWSLNLSRIVEVTRDNDNRSRSDLSTKLRPVMWKKARNAFCSRSTLDPAKSGTTSKQFRGPRATLARLGFPRHPVLSTPVCPRLPSQDAGSRRRRRRPKVVTYPASPGSSSRFRSQFAVGKLIT